MKLPRDIGGADLEKGLRRVGYATVRQRGSHITLKCQAPREHSVTVP